MITLIGDIGVYNNNPVLIGIKSLFDHKTRMETQILTPNIIYDRNAVAKADDFRQGSVWSIYDFFTGRMRVSERHFKPEDYQPMLEEDGYQAEAAPIPKMFYCNDGARIELEAKYSYFGNISAATFYDSEGKLSRKVFYDDGGYMSCQEIFRSEKGDDKMQTLFSPEGEEIFELDIVHYLVSKVRYLPENLYFESLEEFFSWAFVRLVSEKKPEDKIFVAQDNFRRLILHAEFDPRGVYLIADSLIAGPAAEDRDVFFDHYEKVVFNVKSDRDAVEEKFEGGTDAPLVWNNFSAPDKLPRDFSSAPQIYFYVGRESDTVKFDKLVNIFTDLLNFLPNLHIALHCAYPYDPPKIIDQMAENLRGRIITLANPFPSKMLEETVKSDMYVYVSLPEAVPPLSLNYAIAAKLPILTFFGQSAIESFVSADNGRSAGYEQITTVIQRALTQPESYFDLADDLEAAREYFSPEATLERWLTIFANSESKL